jgi:hypothetical protein
MCVVGCQSHATSESPAAARLVASTGEREIYAMGHLEKPGIYTLPPGGISLGEALRQLGVNQEVERVELLRGEKSIIPIPTVYEVMHDGAYAKIQLQEGDVLSVSCFLLGASK